MKKSDNRILTTHTGSLPRPPGMAVPLYAQDAGRDHDRAALAAGIKQSVTDIVRRQLDLGIDIINDGEHSKFNFIAYGRARLGGLSPNPNPVAMMGASRNSHAFPQTYAEMASMNAARSPEVANRRKMPTVSTISTAPVTYIGQAEVARDIANLKSAVQASGKTPADMFMTAISPNNLEYYHRNGYYKTDDEHLEAIANAMNVEYRAIVDAGLVLQIDDPRMATHYNRTPDASIEDCRKFIARRVEVVNLALKGIPRDRVRFHTCYSVNIAPRVHDMELRHYIDLMLRINAQAFSFEAANPRHDHEWAVWKETSCPTISFSFRAWCHTACTWSSTRNSSRSKSSAMRESSGATVCWPATIAGSRRRPPATRSTPRSLGRSLRPWSKVPASRRRGCGRAVPPPEFFRRRLRAL